MTRSLASAYRILLGSVIWIWQVPMTADEHGERERPPEEAGNQ